MYAMDYPYQFEASEVLAMDSVGTAADRDSFYAQNARNVFGL